MNAATSRLTRLWPWAAGSVFFLLFFWRGLDCGFFQDDWGWLHIGVDRQSSHVLSLLFAPKAHGNIRPWSENLFFFGLYRIFGMDPLPFRIVVFATVVADLFLFAELVRKLTGSAWAAFAAEIFWLISPPIAPSFCWTCIYNETQYLFFILLALLLFINDRYWWQIAAFIFGLGSLETMVVYPALASLYALLFDRKKFKSTIPLYGISAAFTVIHFIAAPAVKDGPYAMHLDARIFTTLGRYIQLLLGPQLLSNFIGHNRILLIAAILLALGSIAAICAAGRIGLFGAGWFLILLSPVLMLPDHVLDYLLTGPALGFAIVLGAALVSRWRYVGAAVAVLYVAVALPTAWMVTTWNYERSQMSQDLVEGIVEYSRTHPGKDLLLTGVDDAQFFAAIVDVPFDLYGVRNVYLAPGADGPLHDPNHFAPLFLMPPERARERIDQRLAIVLDVAGNHLRNVTPVFRMKLEPDAALR